MLEELSTALQEGYRAIGLHNLVIYFTRFQNGDDGGAMPWVVTQCGGSVEQGCEVGGRSHMAPLEKFISDT